MASSAVSSFCSATQAALGLGRLQERVCSSPCDDPEIQGKEEGVEMVGPESIISLFCACVLCFLINDGCSGGRNWRINRRAGVKNRVQRLAVEFEDSLAVTMGQIEMCTRYLSRRFCDGP
jgi:hypothetical protein